MTWILEIVRHDRRMGLCIVMGKRRIEMCDGLGTQGNGNG